MKANKAVVSEFMSASKVKSTHLIDTKNMLSSQEAQAMSNW